MQISVLWFPHEEGIQLTVSHCTDLTSAKSDKCERACPRDQQCGPNTVLKLFEGRMELLSSPEKISWVWIFKRLLKGLFLMAPWWILCSFNYPCLKMDIVELKKIPKKQLKWVGIESILLKCMIEEDVCVYI